MPDEVTENTDESTVDTEEFSSEAVSALSMTDGDVVNLDFDQYVASLEEPSTDGGSSESTEETTDTDSTETTDEDTSTEEGEETDESTDTDDVNVDEEVSDDEDTSEEETDLDETNSDDLETEETDDTEIDYEKAYKDLMGPFKANKSTITPKSIEDAKRLMSMGANYNKKMASLKPNLKLMKMLDNNGLLDEEKLSFLIDLDKKDPKAVQKLLKDSNIDPMDLDLDKDAEYKPSTYTVNDKEVELDGILDNLRDTDSYSTLVEFIDNKWDDASKKVVADQPDILEVLNEHVANGYHDLIDKRIQYERALGRLVGVPYLQAYKVMGDQITAEGGFGNQSSANSDTSEVTSTNKSKTVDKKVVRSKKKAAASTRTSKPTKTVVQNPLEMSDADFEKTLMTDYI